MTEKLLEILSGLKLDQETDLTKIGVLILRVLNESGANNQFLHLTLSEGLTIDTAGNPVQQSDIVANQHISVSDILKMASDQGKNH